MAASQTRLDGSCTSLARRVVHFSVRFYTFKNVLVLNETISVPSLMLVNSENAWKPFNYTSNPSQDGDKFTTSLLRCLSRNRRLPPIYRTFPSYSSFRFSTESSIGFEFSFLLTLKPHHYGFSHGHFPGSPTTGSHPPHSTNSGDSATSSKKCPAKDDRDDPR